MSVISITDSVETTPTTTRDTPTDGPNPPTDGVRLIPKGTLNSSPVRPRRGLSMHLVDARKICTDAVHTTHIDVETGAHHHGHIKSMIYILGGRARMYWGENLEFTVEADRGDCIYVPPYVPHREIIDASTDGETLRCVLMRGGHGTDELATYNFPAV